MPTGSWPRPDRPTSARRCRRAVRTPPARRNHGIRRSPLRGSGLTTAAHFLSASRPRGWTGAPPAPRTRAGPPTTDQLRRSSTTTRSNRTGSAPRPPGSCWCRSPTRRTHPAGPSTRAPGPTPPSTTTPPGGHPQAAQPCPPQPVTRPLLSRRRARAPTPSNPAAPHSDPQRFGACTPAAAPRRRAGLRAGRCRPRALGLRSSRNSLARSLQQWRPAGCLAPGSG